MPPSAGPYAASCNPARKVKIARTEPDNQDINCNHHPDMNPQPVQQPAKRGRKPGPLSRSARETQRKLNHSIIEKARRTKINEALATLKQLIPPDFGYPKNPSPPQDDDDDDPEDDDEYHEGRKMPSNKKPGKKEEKEKEFKLEILVRTVAFTRHLLDRVAELEVAVQSSTHAHIEQTDPRETLKRKRSSEDEGQRKRSPHQTFVVRESLPPSRPHSSSSAQPSPRLPSISSWLPNIDPVLLPQPQQACEPPSQLPSPPSSTQFTPLKPFQMPPALSLGPVASNPSASRPAVDRNSPVRTPEEQSAASLLLHISTSPSFRPTASVGCPPLELETRDMRRRSPRSPSEGSELEHLHARSVETPSSILGISR